MLLLLVVYCWRRIMATNLRWYCQQRIRHHVCSATHQHHSRLTKITHCWSTMNRALHERIMNSFRREPNASNSPVACVWDAESSILLVAIGLVDCSIPASLCCQCPLLCSSSWCRRPGAHPRSNSGYLVVTLGSPLVYHVWNWSAKPHDSIGSIHVEPHATIANIRRQMKMATELHGLDCEFRWIQSRNHLGAPLLILVVLLSFWTTPFVFIN